MRMRNALLIALALIAIPALSSQAQRRVSEEALIFRRLKAGVCTVYGDNGHGSGFLVDTLGIILTNDHVVGGASRIRVLFGDSTRAEAVMLATDEKRDVAVILVNPAVVASLPTLQLAEPSDTMVFEGERVIAIGSPLNQELIMTTGIVSKVEPTAVISDVNINHGNSGGPLLNLDGRVIAINTFLDPGNPNGPGVSGSVTVEAALPLLAKARERLQAIVSPSPRRLPTASKVPFPLESLRAAAETEKFKRTPYEVSALVSTGKFNVVTVTPVYDAWRSWRTSVRLAKNTKRREDKGGVATGAQDPTRQLREWMRYAGDYSPVVTIQIAPKVGQTAGSIIGNILGAAAAGAAGTGYYRGSYRYEFKADFLKAEVWREDRLIDDIGMFRTMIPAIYATAQWDGEYSMEDQARTGVFVCDPGAFAPLSDDERAARAAGSGKAGPGSGGFAQRRSLGGDELKANDFPRIHVKAWSVERPANPYEFDLPAATVKPIWEDFAPWRVIAGL